MKRVPSICLGFLVACILAIATPATAQFSFTATAGPPPSCPTNPALGFDKANGVAYAGSQTKCWSTLESSIYTAGAQTPLTTVTTAQTMWTVTPSGSFMNYLNRTLRICGEAMFSNASTTPAITISVKIGSTVSPVSVTTANNANTNASSPLLFCFTIQTAAVGTSGTDEAHGWVEDTVGSIWSSGTAVATYVDGNTAVSSTYDHTVANAIAVQIASTAALTSVTPRYLTMEVVN